MSEQRCRAVITGVSGQDGVYLSILLDELGYDIYGVSRNPNAYLEKVNFIGKNPKINLIQGDLSDASFVKRLLLEMQPEVIFHLSGQSSVSASFIDPDATYKSIAESTAHLLWSIYNYSRHTKFVNAASSECFGDFLGPADSSTPLRGLSPYADAKIYTVEMVRKFRKKYSLHASNAFLFPHESILRDPRFLFGRIFHQTYRMMMNDISIKFEPFGALRGMRDIGIAAEYVYGLYLIHQLQTPCDCVIGTGIQTPLKLLIQELLKGLGHNPVGLIDDDCSFGVSRTSSNCFANINEPRQILNWAPSQGGLKAINQLAIECRSNIARLKGLISG